MRFVDKKAYFQKTIETVCLFLSSGAVFLQIMVLGNAIEAYQSGNFSVLLPLMLLSGFAFVICGINVLLTKVNFLKGITEGRTKTYLKDTL